MPAKLQQLFRRYPKLIMGCSVLAFLGIQSIFSFCGKKTCVAFNNPDYDAWFPYKQDQFFVLTSNGETDTLRISYVNRSEQIEMNMGYGSRGCNISCEANGTFENDSTSSKYFQSRCSLLEETLEPKGWLTVKRLTIQWNDISDTGITVENAFTSLYSPTLTIQGRLFNQVQTIDVPNDIKNTNGIGRLYIAKNQGLIGFEEYPLPKLWLKQ